MRYLRTETPIASDREIRMDANVLLNLGGKRSFAIVLTTSVGINRRHFLCYESHLVSVLSDQPVDSQLVSAWIWRVFGDCEVRPDDSVIQVALSRLKSRDCVKK